MSNIHKDDIVEFFYENGECEFGLVIEVLQTETIDALVVAVFDSLGKHIMIRGDRVKNTWRNLKGYVTDCQILRAEIERLKGEVADRDIEGYAGFMIGVDQMKKIVAEKDKEIEGLKAALTDMCELWGALGKQIPPLLVEQKYLNATAVLVNTLDKAGSAEEIKQ